jgi:hypothetical protein
VSVLIRPFRALTVREGMRQATSRLPKEAAPKLV